MTDLSGDVVRHANRGVVVQLVVRGVLVAFVALTVIVIPPVQGAALCAAIVVAYAVAAALFAAWAWRGGPAVAGWAWLGLFGDAAVLCALTLIAGVSAEESWTSDVLANGFFLIPAVAATQLRPLVCAGVVVPTIAVYLLTSVATQAANEEPSASIALRTLALAGLGIGCIGLSHVQRSRVRAIGGLLDDRTALLDDLVDLERRERRELSERLHDGALQYVLAARQELDDLGDEADPSSVNRLEHALTESSRLLRSTVAELHPAVLQHVGLARAVADLARSSSRGQLVIAVDVAAWSDDARTDADALLYSAARELVGNVVKHADAKRARVVLELRHDSGRLVIADDGRGITDDALRRSLEHGHIGLRSQTLRVEAAGGTLTVDTTSSGTTVTVTVPAHPAAGP